MTVRVVGAGLGRTGTLSLKAALERLLGAPCYHMAEVFAHPEHVDVWTAAFKGHQPDWKKFLSGYAAEVDWPASAFWFEIAEVFPKAIILLSTRDSSETWWNSANETIFRGIDAAPPGKWKDMVEAMFGYRFTRKHRRPRGGDRGVREATTPTFARARRSRGWSSTSPATAGSRCAKRSACPCRTSPSRTRTRARSSSSVCAQPATADLRPAR